MYTGSIIKLLRTAGGLSQGNLAKELQVSRAYLCQVEKGRRDPSLVFLRTVSRALKVPLILLLADTEGVGGDDRIGQELRSLLGDLLTAKVQETRGRTREIKEG